MNSAVTTANVSNDTHSYNDTIIEYVTKCICNRACLRSCL